EDRKSRFLIQPHDEDSVAADRRSARDRALVRSASLAWSSSAAENSRRLIKTKAAEVLDIVKHSRRHQEQTVKSVKQSSVAGNACPHVFDPDITFDRGQHQITELSRHAHNQTERDQFDGGIDGRGGKNK